MATEAEAEHGACGVGDPVEEQRSGENGGVEHGTAGAAIAELKRQALAGQPVVDGLPPEDIAQALIELAQERADAEDKWKRALAECSNMERRFAQRNTETRRAAIKGTVGAIVPVIDTFDLALAQDPAKATSSQVLDGLRAIREAFLVTLRQQGVETIQPAINDEFCPGEHEAVTQVHSPQAEPGRIAGVFQAGYRLEDWIIRPAKVSIAKAADA